jgi:hypothetical protein
MTAVALPFVARIPLAEDSALQLTWRAPEGCPSGAEVEAQVAELLGNRGCRRRGAWSP